jgi:hypothetical protein
MEIYYITGLVFLVFFSVFMLINTLKYKKQIVIKDKELDILSDKVKVLSRKLMINNATLQTCMSNVESLKIENSNLKNKILNNQKKKDVINNFINDIKKT